MQIKPQNQELAIKVVLTSALRNHSFQGSLRGSGYPLRPLAGHSFGKRCSSRGGINRELKGAFSTHLGAPSGFPNPILPAPSPTAADAEHLETGSYSRRRAPGRQAAALQARPGEARPARGNHG
ncbi:hypothetical protein VULLAG_LOCUS19003 [Vulpes lagopus]